MANFRFTGPACCCCNNLYVGLDSASANDQRRHDTVGATPGDAALFYEPQYFARGRTLDFDPVHKRVFVARGVVPTDDNTIFRYSETFTDQTTLLTLGASEYPVGVTSDSDNEILYIVTVDIPVTSAALHSVNHDGTGYTTVGALTNTPVNGRIPIHYCRANGKLYYCTNTDQELYRIDTDGTNDTLIASGATTNSDVMDCTVANDLQYVFWIDNAGFNGETSRIYRSDLDGANITLIYSGAVLSSGVSNERFRGPQWSHKNQRLYFWYEESLDGVSLDLDHGWSSIKFDGTDYRLHIPRGNGTDWWAFGTNAPFDWRLACGYETLGAASTA